MNSDWFTFLAGPLGPLFHSFELRGMVVLSAGNSTLSPTTTLSSALTGLWLWIEEIGPGLEFGRGAVIQNGYCAAEVGKRCGLERRGFDGWRLVGRGQRPKFFV